VEENQMDGEMFGLALFFYVAFLFSTVCHEAAHALVAKWGGDETAYLNGQVTLNPMPHIQHEPFGLGIFPLLSLALMMSGQGMGVFGFASAPFDPYWAVRNPKKAGWMAMAGPGANLLLALGSLVVLKLGLLAGLFELSREPRMFQVLRGTEEFSDAAAVFLGVMAFENLLLGCWNLLPIPPMDGFSMGLFFIPEDKVPGFLELRSQIGMFFPVAILLIGRVFSEYFYPLAGAVLRFVFL
jgi:Zn-dependent protease